jgi:hypothetical protein
MIEFIYYSLWLFCEKSEEYSFLLSNVPDTAKTTCGSCGKHPNRGHGKSGTEAGYSRSVAVPDIFLFDYERSTLSQPEGDYLLTRTEVSKPLPQTKRGGKTYEVQV